MRFVFSGFRISFEKKTVAYASKNPISEYTFREEVVNGLTHGLGTVLSVAALVILVVFAAAYGTPWHIVTFSIFGVTLVLLYLASTLYHSLPEGLAKRIFKVVDHSAIYLLIAGSYTPFMLVNLRGAWGWSILGVIWACAILGIILKIVCVDRFEKLSVAVYIGMGWICLIAFKQIMIHVPFLSVVLLALGGLSYTLGIIFYAWRKLPYNHGIWHLFVLGGSTLHFFSVLFTLRSL
ncbi:MAG: hemolysin III family protein [Sedimentisphaerales bacterium]|nr:hemolysin III family protein [Sedimentisphaerales bacterium]